MDVSLITEAVTVATQQGLGLAKLLIHPPNFVPNSNLAPSDQSAGVLQISAVIFDALAPPPVKSNPYKTARRTLLRKKQRTRRKSFSGGDSEEGGFFGGDSDGTFGGAGGSWGGGRGWNFNGFGGQNWDESSWSSSSGFAYGFIYEVIYWIALSNCVHFAFKKVVRIVADGIAETGRDKVPIRLTSMC